MIDAKSELYHPCNLITVIFLSPLYEYKHQSYWRALLEPHRVQTSLAAHHNLECFVEVLKLIGNFRSYMHLINLPIQLVFRTPECFEYKSLTEYPIWLVICGYICTICTNRSLVQIHVNTLVKSIDLKKSATTFYIQPLQTLPLLFTRTFLTIPFRFVKIFTVLYESGYAH